MTEYNVRVFGSGGVGKSCLTTQFVQNVFMPKYNPTIEDVYKTSIEVDEKKYSLEIVDTAGSDEFSSMRDRYIESGHGFVLVYSITSRATFSELQGYYDRIIDMKNSDTGGLPAIVVVGNKCDLSDERAVTRAVGQDLAREWNCSFFETSAKNRTNVTEVFYDLVRQMNQKYPVSSESEPIVSIKRSKSPSTPSVRADEKSGKCCVLL